MENGGDGNTSSPLNLVSPKVVLWYGWPGSVKQHMFEELYGSEEKRAGLKFTFYHNMKVKWYLISFFEGIHSFLGQIFLK